MRQSQESLMAVSTALESAIRLLDLGYQAPICDCKIAFLTDSDEKYELVIFTNNLLNASVAFAFNLITGLIPFKLNSNRSATSGN